MFLGTQILFVVWHACQAIHTIECQCDLPPLLYFAISGSKCIPGPSSTRVEEITRACHQEMESKARLSPHM